MSQFLKELQEFLFKEPNNELLWSHCSSFLRNCLLFCMHIMQFGSVESSGVVVWLLFEESPCCLTCECVTVQCIEFLGLGATFGILK